MAFWTDEAERQLLVLHTNYVGNERYEAAIRLLAAVREAMRLLESGPPPGRRSRSAWTGSAIRDACQDQGVAFHFQQWGGTNKKARGREIEGRTWDEWPDKAGVAAE